MSVRVAIMGASGYAGAELTAILARHPRVSLTGLYRSGNGSPAPFDSIHPSLAGLEGPALTSFDETAFDASSFDCVFLATPNETSADLAPRLLDAGLRIVDLSGSFRLKSASQYMEWYGFEHPRPALLEEAVYGLTETCNGELRKARIVANPGCYPTAILLALLPIAHDLDRSQPIICDAKSGVSGAGRKSDVDFSFAELAGNFKAYNPTHHRHTPEIRQALPVPRTTPFVFVPHLLPTVRGILATIHVGFSREKTAEEIAERYATSWGQSPFVRILPHGRLPELRNVVGTPRAEIGFALFDGGRRAVVVSVIDNLLKGAASQAVQNFNRMFGFTETEGLA